MKKNKKNIIKSISGAITLSFGIFATVSSNSQLQSSLAQKQFSLGYKYIIKNGKNANFIIGNNKIKNTNVLSRQIDFKDSSKWKKEITAHHTSVNHDFSFKESEFLSEKNYMWDSGPKYTFKSIFRAGDVEFGKKTFVKPAISNWTINRNNMPPLLKFFSINSADASGSIFLSDLSYKDKTGVIKKITSNTNPVIKELMNNLIDRIKKIKSSDAGTLNDNNEILDKIINIFRTFGYKDINGNFHTIYEAMIKNKNPKDFSKNFNVSSANDISGDISRLNSNQKKEVTYFDYVFFNLLRIQKAHKIINWLNYKSVFLNKLNLVPSNAQISSKVAISNIEKNILLSDFWPHIPIVKKQALSKKILEILQHTSATDNNKYFYNKNRKSLIKRIDLYKKWISLFVISNGKIIPISGKNGADLIDVLNYEQLDKIDTRLFFIDGNIKLELMKSINSYNNFLNLKGENEFTNFIKSEIHLTNPESVLNGINSYIVSNNFKLNLPSLPTGFQYHYYKIMEKIPKKHVSPSDITLVDKHQDDSFISNIQYGEGVRVVVEVKNSANHKIDNASKPTKDFYFSDHLKAIDVKAFLATLSFDDATGTITPASAPLGAKMEFSYDGKTFAKGTTFDKNKSFYVRLALDGTTKNKYLLTNDSQNSKSFYTPKSNLNNHAAHVNNAKTKIDVKAFLTTLSFNDATGTITPASAPLGAKMEFSYDGKTFAKGTTFDKSKSFYVRLALDGTTKNKYLLTNDSQNSKSLYNPKSNLNNHAAHVNNAKTKIDVKAFLATLSFDDATGTITPASAPLGAKMEFSYDGKTFATGTTFDKSKSFYVRLALDGTTKNKYLLTNDSQNSKSLYNPKSNLNNHAAHVNNAKTKIDVKAFLATLSFDDATGTITPASAPLGAKMEFSYDGKTFATGTTFDKSKSFYVRLALDGTTKNKYLLTNDSQNSKSLYNPKSNSHKISSWKLILIIVGASVPIVTLSIFVTMRILKKKKLKKL